MGKKGSKSTLGYKAFARTDEEGFVDKVHTTPANQAESPQFGTMIDGANAQRVLADKAYASKANRASLRGKYQDGIMCQSQSKSGPDRGVKRGHCV